MTETELFLSIEFISDLRNKLSKVVEKIEDRFHRIFFQDILDAFLLELPSTYEEIQRKGAYKALVLGTSDLSIINDFVGVNTSALASNEKYLISIYRTFRDRSLKIDFVENLDLTEDSRKIIASVFRRKNPETDIDRWLREYPQKSLPSLLINNFDLSLLQSFDDDIRLLKSTGAIKKVSLGVHFSSDTSRTGSVFSLCRSVDIVPNGYDFSSLNIASLENGFSTTKFYNLVILNSRDDFLIQVFFDFLLSYETKLEIHDKLSRRVLESIFYVYDKAILSQTRLLYDQDQKHEKYKEISESIILGDSVNDRHSRRVVLLVVSYLSYYFLRNSSTPSGLVDRALKGTQKSVGRIFHKLRVVIGDAESKTDSFNQQEKINEFSIGEAGDLLYSVLSSKSTQDILFELSNLMSFEVLSLMTNLGRESQDKND